MSRLRHSTHSITINAPYGRAFAYLSNWRTQPEWATSFVKGVRDDTGPIFMTTPFGEVPIAWRTNQSLGTIDIVFPGDSLLPTRLTSMGDGSLVYTFTFSMPADTPEEVFAAGQRNMDEELANLKRILEAEAQ
jgi:hypothetical protein